MLQIIYLIEPFFNQRTCSVITIQILLYFCYVNHMSQNIMQQVVAVKTV